MQVSDFHTQTEEEIYIFQVDSIPILLYKVNNLIMNFYEFMFL